MIITINSSRFGALEIPEDSVIEFPTGLIGMGGSRYVLLAPADNSPFAWLHSIEDGDLALPVTNPWLWFGDFEVEIDDEEAARCGLDGTTGTDVFVTVRAAESLKDFTANLRAPIIIANGTGHQVINQSSGAELRASLFAEIAPAAAA